MNYKELYTSALQKLDSLSEEELKAFVEMSGEMVAEKLFAVHTHYPEEADELHPKLAGRIIYFEEDIVDVLQALGLPKPKWREQQ